jgi:peptidoglycan hydrolase-like protein with peptidoglycan-binding domain
MNPKPFISAPKKPARPAADGYPGEVLQYGGSGDGVRRMQSCLSALHPVFPVVPNMPVDGEFGPATQASVKAFQSFFGLDADGAIGPATWNKVITVFRNLPRLVSPVHPGSSLRAGSRGQSVQIIQKHINGLASVYPCIPAVEEDGIYGPETEEAVRAFQRRFGLTEDGVIGADVWNQIISRYNLIGLSYNPDAPLPLKTQAGSAEGGGSLMAMMLMMMFMREMGA